jgi:hypothetical protein
LKNLATLAFTDYRPKTTLTRSIRLTILLEKIADTAQPKELSSDTNPQKALKKPLKSMALYASTLLS